MTMIFRIGMLPFLVAAALGGSDESPMFRGNSQLTGLAHATLPPKLSVQWKFDAPDAISSTAAITNGSVYVGCEDGALFALNFDDGTLRWKYDTGTMIQSSPAVANDTVYFGDDDGVLHAVGTRDGKVRWTFKTGAQIISSPNITDNRLVFGSYDAFLYCLDARAGTLIWKFETQGRIHGTPGIADGHVLVAGCDEHLRILTLSDGREVGHVSMGSVSGASAAIGKNRVFVGTYGNQVRCIDWKKRQPVWSFEDPDRQFPFMSSAAVTDRAVVIGGRDKKIRAFAPDSGKVLWTFAAKGRVDSSATIVGDRVFIGASDGVLYELDLRTGRESWRFETGSAITASPAIAKGRLVIGTLDGVLYCFGK